MSNQRDREKRREERIAAESKAAGGDRRTRLLQLSAAGVFLAIIVVVVVIIVAGSGDSGGDSANLVGKAEVEKLLGDIPQNATIIGKTSAPVKLYEYGDLQCSGCKFYSEEILPKIIENQVKKGEVSITFRNFTIIGPDSVPAGEAALAAGAQGMGWSYIETWYRNQGPENGGYVTDEFVESMAKYVGIPNVAKFMDEWKGHKYKSQVESTTGQAEKFGFGATPSFAIEGPGSEGLELLGNSESTGAIEEAIKKAS